MGVHYYKFMFVTQTGGSGFRSQEAVAAIGLRFKVWGLGFRFSEFCQASDTGAWQDRFHDIVGFLKSCFTESIPAVRYTHAITRA